MKSIHNFDFAYIIGNFMADGSFYSTERGCRFEFVDGSPYKKELKYSLEHLFKIKKILENFLNKKLPDIGRRGNKFVLSSRNKELSNLFIKILTLSPGKKHKTVNISVQYKNSRYEKNFWIGFLDGDGSIARKSRKISLESMSKKIIDSFSVYLKKNKILFSKYKSKRKNSYSYVIVIRSVSFRDFANKIGFSHPPKLELSKKLANKDFFIENDNNIRRILIQGMIDYTKIFDNSVFIGKGRELLLKYGDKKYRRENRENVKFTEIVSLMKKNKLKKECILEEINKYRFKKSKGSTNLVKLPLFLSDDLLKIGKFVRTRLGGISFSKRYIESFNEDFNKILKITKNIFDITPKYTCKQEPIFCSGVLADFFNGIIKRKVKL